MNIQLAKTNLTREFFQHLDGLTLPECCGPVNRASRAVIRAYKSHYGSCWLGNINLCREPRNKPVMREYKSGMVCNFEYLFVVPQYDAVLEKLIIDRDRSPYTGAKEDMIKVGEIMDRIELIGGHVLYWS